jgi:hypothetical protein
MPDRKNINSKIEFKELTLDDIVNKLHDPDLSYLYIRQAFKNSENGVDLEGLTNEKRISVNLLYKLEVFRATMQYIEEFSIYFLSYTNGINGITKRLTQTLPKEVRKNFFNFLLNNNHDKFAQKQGISNYNELLKYILGYDRISKGANDSVSEEELSSMIDESIVYLKKSIDEFAKFYIDHLDLYNAIKHGNRIFPNISDHIMIVHDSEEYKQELGNEYFTAICKASNTDHEFPLFYPITFLLNSSLHISNKVHSIFKFMRRNVMNQISKEEKFKCDFFQVPQDQNEEKIKLIKVFNNDAILVIPHSAELDEYLSKNPFLGKGSFNFTLEGKTLYLHFNKEERSSLNYPISSKLLADYAPGISPTVNSNISFQLDIDKLSITQYHNLLKIQELAQKGKIKSMQYVDDSKRMKIGNKENFDFIKFPEIPILYNDNILSFLSLLEKITDERIPVPFDLSTNQESIIMDNCGNLKNLSLKENIKIVEELKKQDNKMRYTKISLRKLNSNSEEICNKDLGILKGTWFNLNLSNVESEKQFQEDIYEKPGHFFLFKVEGVDSDPDKLIDDIISFCEDPINKQYPTFKNTVKPQIKNPKFDYYFKYSFNKPEFWFQEHQIEITIKLLDYLQ